MQQNLSTKKGSKHQIEITGTAFKGKGIGKIGELAVFVKDTAPGDVVEVMITKRKKNFREAKVLQFIKKSDLRIEPKCQHASVCGGCSWQHLSYANQLQFKTQQVTDHMQRIAKIETLVNPAIASADAFYYRNKMEYSFGTKQWLTKEQIDSDEYISDEGMFGGLHAPGRFDKILPLNACYLQDKRSFEILDWTRNYAVDHQWTAYDSFKHEGFLRHLMIRNAFHTSDFMVNLVTNSEQKEQMEKYTEALINTFPFVSTVINNVNTTKSPVSTGEWEKVYYGPGFIKDKIGKHSFQIHANTFFQTNTVQAERLYEIAREFAEIKDNDIIYDLYCGVGTLSLFVADKAKFVLGIELNPISIKNAIKNAQDNQVSHVDFIEGDMKEAFNHEIIAKYGKPDVLITDPPRAGMHPDVVKNLIELKVPKIVYVSCESSTMARDLAELKQVYTIEKIQPVDMFPQTYHIETVSQLVLKQEYL